MRIWIWLCVWCGGWAFAQHQPAWINPLPIPLQLSGNFGELRSNHFHSGFDFKTQQREGLPVRAAAGGYISRIKISATGYGKALYITHPNGYTTVYGHLQKALGAIGAYIRQQHYSQKRFEIDVQVPPDALVVHAGDTIALSGNSGGSDGPHLHFEIRNTQTEEIINPFLLGFKSEIPDHKPPQIRAIYAYPLSEGAQLNGQHQAHALAMHRLPNSADYATQPLRISGVAGLGIEAFDDDDVSYNSNGLYEVRTFLNGQLHYHYVFNCFRFDETRQVNALIDYGRYVHSGLKVQQLFRQIPYPSAIVQGAYTGELQGKPGQQAVYLIECADVMGNITRVHVPVYFTSPKPTRSPQLQPAYNYALKAGRSALIVEDDFELDLHANSLYADVKVQVHKNGQAWHLHENNSPIREAIRWTLNDSTDQALRDKKYMSYFDGKRWKYVAGQWKNHQYQVWLKNWGTYQWQWDEQPPQVKWINAQFEVQAGQMLRFKAVDAESGMAEYEGWLNGQWVLLDYDAKNDVLLLDLEANMLREGTNALTIKVKDRVGNLAIFDASFTQAHKP